jgi:gamma-glutamyltranspeptidase/glutathione hydrolase
MCPAVVLRDGKPLMAVGARGGRKIPNAVFDVLTHYIADNSSLKKAVAAPRLSTDGGLGLSLEEDWPATEVEQFRKLGYATESAGSAIVSAVEFDVKSRQYHASKR